MKSFIDSYIRTALWSSMDDNGDNLDKNYGPDDLTPETLTQIEKDCEDFCERTGHILCTLDHPLSQIAHDFWLTRNRHGAGFWDGDYPHPQAKQLTEISHSFGSFVLYVVDDGRIYQE